MKVSPWALPAALGIALACGGCDREPTVVVLETTKISASSGGAALPLAASGLFGRAVASLGDLDADGVPDLAVGSFAPDGGPDRGAVWILYLDRRGGLKRHTRISDTHGGFQGSLADGDLFGTSVVVLEDRGGDGYRSIAVGAARSADGGYQRGAVWILSLDSAGGVRQHRKLGAETGDLPVPPADGDHFGYAVAPLDDLDGDGVRELAVGMRRDTLAGGVWVLYLNREGSVKDQRLIAPAPSGDGGSAPGDLFGCAVTSLGDLDGDGVGDLAIGAFRDNDGGWRRGAVWILFMGPDLAVKRYAKISDTQGGFDGELDDDDGFGSGVAGLGDLDRDGIADLAVGARRDGDGGPKRGAVWLLLLNRDGSVKRHLKVSDGAGGLVANLDDDDQFGYSVAALGDVNGDGLTDLGVGAIYDDDGGRNAGATYVLLLNPAAVLRGDGPGR